MCEPILFDKMSKRKQTHASSQIRNNQEVSQKRIELWDLSEEELKKYLEPKPKKTILDGPPREDPLTTDELRLLDLRGLLFHERELLEDAALQEYTEQNPIDLKSFKEHVQSLKEGESLYVFSFCYANIWSDEYKEFLLSFEKDSFGRLYIGSNSDLAGILLSKSNKELRPCLGPVAELLVNSDDVGVLITNKSEDEILRKFDSYKEFDLAMPGNTATETLTYNEGSEIDHNHSQKAGTFICRKLNKMGIPLKYYLGRIVMKKDYVVCEKGKCVTEAASEFMKYFHIKMLNYVIQPRCCWTVSSGETCMFKDYYDRYPWTSWPSKV